MFFFFIIQEDQVKDLNQGWLILFLEIYLLAKFSSNTDKTHLNLLIKICRST